MVETTQTAGRKLGSAKEKVTMGSPQKLMQQPNATRNLTGAPGTKEVEKHLAGRGNSFRDWLSTLDARKWLHRARRQLFSRAALDFLR